MTQDKVYDSVIRISEERNCVFEKMAEARKKTTDVHTGKRFRRKPMKCVSSNVKSFQKDGGDSDEVRIDTNNNDKAFSFIEYTSSLSTEVIDIEEECVKAKANFLTERKGVKRKKATSLDQLLSRAVAKECKANQIKTIEKRDVMLDSERLRSKPSSSKHDERSTNVVLDPDHLRPKTSKHDRFTRHPSNGGSCTITKDRDRQHTPVNLPRKQLLSSSSSSSKSQRRRSPSPSSSSFSSSFSSSSSKRENNGSKPNKRTITTNQRYAKLNSTQLQRRLVANARERSRVHALSNAFDALRCTIPSYSTEQKLSKLTILRVAINYIDALSQLLAPPSSVTQAKLEICVDECTAVLQTEYGRSKTK